MESVFRFERKFRPIRQVEVSEEQRRRAQQEGRGGVATCSSYHYWKIPRDAFSLYATVSRPTPLDLSSGGGSNQQPTTC
ncbi:unnamed protein product [Nippostrongylus brasiliensis]|uniref:Uncharacterized protein n=1 Tax=Nippostrongylus brasiliensis TaxID=27835 RepID=A0A0N4Y086_NIPBR|nr:unnamed protein product [Nippostrongylus brasiliensis]